MYLDPMALEEFLVGRCQLRLRDIEIDPDYCRDKIERAVASLKPIFEDPNHFNPHAEIHQFPIVTGPEELRRLLNDSRISHPAFTESQQNALLYPRLTSLHGKLRCVHGRQRYEAAIGSEKLGPDTWWTVKLYCLPEGVDPRVLLRDEVEQDHYQTKYNNGHIFCGILYWEEKGDLARVSVWRNKLSRGEQRRLDILMRLEPVKERLKKLRVFHGILDALELGNVERMIRSHGLPQICRNLDRIYDVWNDITLGEPRVRRAVDVPSVQRLQMLAPSTSRVDRATVQELMRSRQAFHTLVDPVLRAQTEDRILRIEGLIPSLKSFHENMKYLHIVNHVMRSNLVTTLRRGESISKAMSDIWLPPDDCLVEYRDGQFLRVDRPPSQDLSFMIVLAAALRGFPHLCDGEYMGPRCEAGESHTRAFRDPMAVDRFRALARKVGYSVATTEQLLPVAVAEQSAVEPAEGPVERRWNRPYSNSARFCASKLFLPELLENKPMAAYPGTLFVHRDFIRSFFGEIPDLGMIAQGLPQSPQQQQPATLGPDLPDNPFSDQHQAVPQIADTEADIRLLDLGNDQLQINPQNLRRYGWRPIDFAGLRWSSDQSLRYRQSDVSDVSVFPDSLRSGYSSQRGLQRSRTPSLASVTWSRGSARLHNYPSTTWDSLTPLSARSVSRSTMYSRPSNSALSRGRSSIHPRVSISPRSITHSTSFRRSSSLRSTAYLTSSWLSNSPRSID